MVKQDAEHVAHFYNINACEYVFELYPMVTTKYLFCDILSFLFRFCLALHNSIYIHTMHFKKFINPYRLDVQLWLIRYCS